MKAFCLQTITPFCYSDLDQDWHCCCAGPSETILDCLQHDLLICVVERVGHADLPNLRLACKALRAAVGDAGLALMPIESILPDQLRQLCTTFHRATSLHLSFSPQLTDQSLEHLGPLASSLKVLDLVDCYWLTDAGAAHLTVLTSLESLSFDAPELRSLPVGFSGLKLLQSLDMACCEGLQNFAGFNVCNLTCLRSLGMHTGFLETLEGISSLTNLRVLNLHDCNDLTALPDEIGALTLLEEVSLLDCEVLRALPASLCRLRSLRNLVLGACAALTALPSRISALSGLRQLNLSGCSSLVALPPGFNRWVGLQCLSAGGAACIDAVLDSLGSCPAVRPLMFQLSLSPGQQ